MSNESDSPHTEQDGHEHARASISARLEKGRDRILQYFEEESRKTIPASEDLDSKSLINSLPVFLEELAETLSDENPQRKLATDIPEVATEHGEQRAELDAYDLDQLIKEYRILRKILFKVLEEDGILRTTDRDIIFEAIERGVQSAVDRFVLLRDRQEDSDRQRLQESDDRLRVAAEATKLGIWDLDIATRKAWRNGSHDRAFGYSEMLPDWDFDTFLKHLHVDDRKRVSTNMTHAMETGGTWHEEFRVIWPDQSVHWMSASGRVVSNEQGTPVRVVGTNREITEQKLLQEQLETATFQAERGLEELHRFFTQAPVAIVLLTGPNYLFTIANPIYERIVGRKVVGKTALEAFSEEEIGHFLPLVERVYKTGVPYVGTELPLRIPDDTGEIRSHFVNLTYHPFKDGDGQITGVFALVQDVTEQVEARRFAEESEAQFRALADAMPTMVWAARADGDMYYYNQSWISYTGLNIDEAKGNGWESALHPDDYASTAEAWRRSLRTSEPYERELRFKEASTQQYRWHLSRAVAVRDKAGQISGWYGTSTDIHEQKLLMEELDIAKAEAETANAAKSAFLANMSHEIRTPLGAILGFTDLMRDKTVSGKEREQFLDTISRNGKALTRIIDDILDLAKVESGKLEVETLEFALLDLIDDVLDLFRERAKSKGLYLRLNISDDVPHNICSDPTRVRQILINIIGNAIKFTHEGGITIQVKATVPESGNTCFTVTVRDTGIGISPEQRERLFQPFVQADNTTSRKFGGSGLGLVLSNRLAKALGGSITIEDCTPGGGTGCSFIISFIAEIPLEAHSHAVLEAARRENVNTPKLRLSGIKVLVADDSPDNRFLVRRVLCKGGAEVDTANNGLEAFRMGMKNGYDVVLMDLQMPEMDGYEATRNLREAGFKKPIIALTAHAMAEERARTRAAGCEAHLTKPLNQAELLEAVEQFGR